MYRPYILHVSRDDLLRRISKKLDILLSFKLFMGIDKKLPRPAATPIAYASVAAGSSTKASPIIIW